MITRSSVQDQILDSLQERGHITSEQIARAERLRATEKAGQSTLFYLVKMGEVTPKLATLALAKHFRVQGFLLDEKPIPPEAIERLPVDIIKGNQVVPVALSENKLYVAMVDPTDIILVDQLRFSANQPVIPVVADEHSIVSFIERYFQEQVDVGEILREFTDESVAAEVLKPVEVEELARQEQVENSPVVKLVNRYLSDAVQRKASDIHFEPHEHEMKVRYRKDGALFTVEAPPKRIADQVVRRLKVLSKLYTDVTKEPQDGQMRLQVGDRVVSFRVSIIPTQYGEKAVLRVLDKGSVNLDLDSLGLTGRTSNLILDAVEQQFGMILVTGPTGSGKTTTLYTTLALMNKPDVNIITVEDPIEYSLPNINQVAINEKLTFGQALRSILRQDPDIIMLGEIRDEETAQTAVKAGMTGHMVISTLHTNDAPSTITRLAEMGVDRFNIAQTLTLVIAQRLVRRLCSHCKEQYEPDERHIRLARLTDDEARQIRFMRGRGCNRCSGGYSGRVGVYEALQMSPDIREMVLRGASTSEIRQKAVRDGMDTLLVSGLQRVRQGQTTIEEVIKKAS